MILIWWNALLTKNLLMFLSRSNEISEGCEKILAVSGSFWSKVFRMMVFTASLWGWNVRVNGILSLFSFCELFSQKCIPNNSELLNAHVRDARHTCPFIRNVEKISVAKRSVEITDRFTCSSANVIYCITCSLSKKLYIGETGRRLGDRFREQLRDVEKDDTTDNASKPVARHVNLPKAF